MFHQLKALLQKWYGLETYSSSSVNYPRFNKPVKIDYGTAPVVLLTPVTTGLQISFDGVATFILKTDGQITSLVTE